MFNPNTESVTNNIYRSTINYFRGFHFPSSHTTVQNYGSVIKKTIENYKIWSIFSNSLLENQLTLNNLFCNKM